MIEKALRASVTPIARESFRFVVIGDTHPDDAEDPVTQPDTFKENIREINLLSPDFVVIVGDLIRGYSDDRELILKEWEDFDRTAAAFEMPFHMVLGNHDIYGEKKPSKENEEIYRNRYGKLYYSFDFGNSHFVLLDCVEVSCMEKIKGDQLDWLKKDLEDHKEAEHIFAFLHKPLWHYEHSNWLTDVHPLLARYNADAVLIGDTHMYEMSGIKDGVRYFFTGGGGGEMGDLEATGGFHHFMFITVRGDKVIYAVVKTGSIKPENVITWELRDKAKAMMRSLEPRLTISDPKSVFADTVRADLKLNVPNLFKEPVDGEVIWKIPDGSPWLVSPIQCRFHIDPGGTARLTFHLSADGPEFSPLPKFKASIMSASGEVLLKWPFGKTEMGELSIEYACEWACQWGDPLKMPPWKWGSST